MVTLLHNCNQSREEGNRSNTVATTDIVFLFRKRGRHVTSSNVPSLLQEGSRVAAGVLCWDTKRSDTWHCSIRTSQEGIVDQYSSLDRAAADLTPVWVPVLIIGKGDSVSNVLR